MAGKYTWKLLVTGAVLLFAVLNLIPLRSTEFETYITERAASQPEFLALAERARQRQADSDGEKSFYVSLREIADEEEIDLSRFFPDVRLEEALVNLGKRNTILLEHLLEQSRGKIKLGLDLRGGVSITLEVDESQATAAAPGAPGREEELEKAIQIIRDRIDAFGVAEPIIRPVGENRIEVQLAGVSTRENPDIINLIQKPARLEFSLVYMQGTPDTVPQDQVPPIYRPMTLEDERRGEVYTENLYVKIVPEMTGEAVEYAAAQYNQYGSPEIALRFTSEGARRFAELTRGIEEENARNRRGEGSYGRLAIILDGKLYSAPSVREEIAGGSAVIYGSFTAREAQDLADVLNNPLDLPLRIAEMSEVGPSLAQDSIDSGQRAFVWAIAITAVFMAVYYTAAGVLAVVSMVFNVVVIAGVMASIGTTMSMPGIAGLVLTLGMAVDSNILIFERMREELATGKNLRASLEAGFEKAFSAILDANVTTLIVATIMMSLGTGPVKGFGVVLTIGIFSTMFAALLVSRVLLELTVHTGLIKRLKFLSFVPNTSIDFMRFFRPAFIASWTVVLIGLIMVFIKGNDIYGIDFSGGDELTLTFEQRVDTADIRVAAQLAGVNDVTPVYFTPIGGTTEQLKLQTPFEQGDLVLAKLNELHPEAGFQLEGTSRIGASVSSQIKWNAGFSIVLSLVGILLYVAFRFEMGYGVGAVIATVHDLFMTIGVFVMCGRQFNSAMVGAILLVVGYSINDTIVVFDRIREELQLNPNMRLRDVINHALNRTLQRTVITGATTLFASLMLFLLAGGAVNDLALTLIIGIVVGTFSSIFIASPVFFWWHKGDRKHVEASHDITPKYEWSASSRATE